MASGSIEKELRDRMCTLADRKVRWVDKPPVRKNECCLAYNSDPGNVAALALSYEALAFLNNFTSGYAAENEIDEKRGISAVDFNDFIADERREVIWMLEEAIDLAAFLEI